MTGDPDVSVVGPGDVESRAASVAGRTRETVFEADEALLARIRLPGGGESEWHAHGEREAYGVVVEGRARIEYGPDRADAIDVGVGEFFRVPAGVVHRDANPSDDECVALVAFVGPGDGAVDVAAEEPPSEASHPAPRAAGEDDLVPTARLKNLTRLTPFPDAPVQQVRGHASGRVESDWHHHGDNDVFGHVLAGEGYVEWGPGPDERKLARAGEFFRVPAGVVHRDVNPSDDEQEYVLWLTGSEPRTVRVDGPESGSD
ncbi:cupin domain-containing protein [Halegenticoccus soli]|uniref:cupin domain-containing protein n=1 Tax=Halegenticoccus soli TaxID=1985678 RepID=UPI000C6DC3E1|nr:cupin domain-containing protein [Halegenticoccus soli]